MSRFRAVILDLDGTLVDSAADLAASVNHARGTLGLEPVPLEKVRSYIGDGVNVLIARAVPDEALRPAALEAFREHYAEHLLDRTRPYPDVDVMLGMLDAAGVQLAVVTNKAEGFSRRILEGLGLAPYLRAVIGADSGFGRKPEPKPFRHALASLGVGPDDARAALVVGDGRNDIRGGRAAGMRTCAAGWGLGERFELLSLEPDYWVDGPADVPGIVLSPM